MGQGNNTAIAREFSCVCLEALGAMAYRQYNAVGPHAAKPISNAPWSPAAAKPASDNINAAYLFIKPHAANAKVASVVENGLQEAGLKFTSKGELGME
jgi:hypothetical protein